jgi:hypothetical protein
MDLHKIKETPAGALKHMAPGILKIAKILIDHTIYVREGCYDEPHQSMILIVSHNVVNLKELSDFEKHLDESTEDEFFCVIRVVKSCEASIYFGFSKLHVSFSVWFPEESYQQLLDLSCYMQHHDDYDSDVDVYGLYCKTVSLQKRPATLEEASSFAKEMREYEMRAADEDESDDDECDKSDKDKAERNHQMVCERESEIEQVLAAYRHREIEKAQERNQKKRR